MPHSDNPCEDYADHWLDAIDRWSDCEIQKYEAAEELAELSAGMTVACVGAAATVETIVGGIIGGAACLGALWAVYDKADDLESIIEQCDRDILDMDETQNELFECEHLHGLDSP